MQKKLLAILVLACLGVLLSAYLIFQHYKTAGSSFCVISEYVNCDIVNKSTYSAIFGIPVSVLGFLAYFAIAVMAYTTYKNHRASKFILQWLPVFAGISLAFSLYLTYIEFFVLYAICPFCVTSQVIILLIFILSLLLYAKKDSIIHS